MGLHGRSFEPKPGWNSVRDDVVNGFYRPALRNCSRYDRLTGFFASSAFAVAVRETLDFIGRGGRMRLITSATFSQEDLDAITKSVEDKLSEETERILEDDLGKKCLAIFSRMLTTKIGGVPQLEIKILVPQRGIFHPKVGVFTMDDGSAVSFSGSVNETGMGWAGNIEEFKAFCSWIDQQYVDIDRATFQTFWNNEHADIRTYDLPTAVRERILSIRPGSGAEYGMLMDQIKRMLYGGGQHVERDGISLRGYQNDAIQAWMSSDYRGILEMPTATGKTYTALGCVNRLRRARGRLFTVIVTPYNHLVQQWVDTIEEWNSKAPPDMKVPSNVLNVSRHGKWEVKLKRAVADFNLKNMSGKNIIDDYIVCVTYATFYRKAFVDAVSEVDGDLLLVADEAHNAGATRYREGLLDAYSARLALTATPDRYFDEKGSGLIRSYFNNVAYLMEMKVALESGHLAPYDYYPVFAELNDSETEEYRKLTRAIRMKYERRKKDRKVVSDSPNSPENRRAKLVAKTEQKYEKLVELLRRHGNRLENALIYCHDSEQLKRVGAILSAVNINYETITKSSSMMERRDRISSLEAKSHQCIVAMRCLDEGVDIPSARIGIIMASTGNTLQYIQRRGRLLRKSKGKDHAVIYDILAAAHPREDEQSFAKKLVAKELLRHKEFAENARNKEEALDAIRPVAVRLGIDLDRLGIAYILGL